MASPWVTAPFPSLERVGDCLHILRRGDIVTISTGMDKNALLAIAVIEDDPRVTSASIYVRLTEIEHKGSDRQEEVGALILAGKDEICRDNIY